MKWTRGDYGDILWIRVNMAVDKVATTEGLGWVPVEVHVTSILGFGAYLLRVCKGCGI